MDLKNKTVVVAGRFLGYKVHDVRAALRARGAHIAQAVTSRTDLLVAGRNAGSKLAMAHTMGIAVLDGAQLQAFLEGKAVSLGPRSELEHQINPTNDVLMQLRRLVYSQPSTGLWEEICQAIDHGNPHSTAMAIDYAQQALDAWPGTPATCPIPHPNAFNIGPHQASRELRAMPATWRRQLLSGQDHPKFGLCKALLFGNERVNNTLARNILGSAHLSSLRWLRLKGRLGPRFLLEMGHSQALPALTHLELNRLTLEPKTLARLSTTALGERLKHLGLYQAGQLHALPRHLPPNLHSLDLRGLHLGADWDLQQLGQTLSQLPSLRTLHLGDNGLTADALPMLLPKALLARLKVLGLSSNPLGLSGIKMLLSLPGLEHLDTLDLCDSALNDRCAIALAKNARLKHLRHLWLGNIRRNWDSPKTHHITASGWDALRRSPHLTPSAQACLPTPPQPQPALAPGPA